MRLAWHGSLREVLYPWDSLEVSILRPEGGLVVPGSRKDDTVGHRQAVVQAETSRAQRQGCTEIDDTTLLHGGHCLQRLRLGTLLKDPLEDLVDTQRRHNEICLTFNSRSEVVGIRPIRKILQPTRGIDNVHERSGSRSTDVSMPLTIPLISLIGRTGISSIRLS